MCNHWVTIECCFFKVSSGQFHNGLNVVNIENTLCVGGFGSLGKNCCLIKVILALFQLEYMYNVYAI